jgi:hypothetical protein
VDELLRTMIGQAPAVAVILYLVVRLDRRLEQLQDVLIDLIISEQSAAHGSPLQKKR